MLGKTKQRQAASAARLRLTRPRLLATVLGVLCAVLIAMYYQKGTATNQPQKIVFVPAEEEVPVTYIIHQDDNYADAYDVPAEDGVLRAHVQHCQNHTLLEQPELKGLKHACLDWMRTWQLLMYWTYSKPVPMPGEPRLIAPPTTDKYITFEPDFAQWNNVRVNLEHVVTLAMITGRILVMPSTPILLTWTPWAHIPDFYDVWDFGTMTPVVTMDEYLTRRGLAADDPMRTDGWKLREYLRDGNRSTETVYPAWGPDGTVMLVPSRERVENRTNPTLKQFAAPGGNTDYQREMLELDSPQFRDAHTLHFKMDHPNYRLFGNFEGSFFYPSRAWQDYYMAMHRDHFHYNAEVMGNASLLVHRIRQDLGPYNAIHWRTTDHATSYPALYVKPDLLAERLSALLDTNMSLYIATDSPDRQKLQPVIDLFPNVRFFDDYVKELLPTLPKHWIGLMEQLVCASAERFVGHFVSTLTSYVHRLRGYMSDELSGDKNMYFTNYPEEEGAWTGVLKEHQLWTDATWWEQPGLPIYHAPMWGRDFSFAYKFGESA